MGFELHAMPGGRFSAVAMCDNATCPNALMRPSGMVVAASETIDGITLTSQVFLACSERCLLEIEMQERGNYANWGTPMSFGDYWRQIGRSCGLVDGNGDATSGELTGADLQRLRHLRRRLLDQQNLGDILG